MTANPDASGGLDGLFLPDAAIRRVDGESVLLLGGPRALLLQLAHPKVAQGVSEHSGFASDPFARLRRTLEATSAMVFGTKAEAKAAARAVRRVHAGVVGDGYRANDPELLLWVHATLVDTALRIHARFLRPLPEDVAAEFYDQSMIVAEMLGTPRRVQPPDLDAFRAYMREMFGSLEVSDTARRLAERILRPRVPVVAEPVFLLVRQLTAGLLPPPIRDGYGLSWDPARDAALASATLASRLVLPWVPASLRRARLVS